MSGGGTAGRRRLLGALPALLSSLAVPAPPLRAGAAAAPLTDIAGRGVTLPGTARRIALTEARHVLAMGLLHPDPVSLIVGWGDDLRRMNPPDYAMVRERFPRVDDIPLLRRGQSQDLALETLLAARPEVLVAGLSAVASGLADRVTALGIPVIVIDFFQDPMRNTRPSLALLGRILGREDRAAAFDAFYGERLAAIAARVAGAEAPSVFLHAHAGGRPCCDSPGRGAHDSMIRFCGGRSIGAALLPGTIGTLSFEQVVAADPRLYVATGGPYGGRGGIPLGPGVTPGAASAALADTLRRDRLDLLPAVRRGRAHAVWHGFNDTPAHVVMLELLARWLHPDRCADLDPAATLAALNRDFLAIPMAGTYWADLPAGPSMSRP